MDNPIRLNTREAEILTVLAGKERYGREIRNQYEDRFDRALPLGSLYTTLARMEDKGLITSRNGPTTSKRGGNRRRYFRSSALGALSLDGYVARARQLTQILPELAR